MQWLPFHVAVDLRAGIAVTVLGETFAGSDQLVTFRDAARPATRR